MAADYIGSVAPVARYIVGPGLACVGCIIGQYGVYVVRAFVKLRELLSSNRELAPRFAQLETRLDKKFTEHDQQIAAILSAIRQLMRKHLRIPVIPKMS